MMARATMAVETSVELLEVLGEAAVAESQAKLRSITQRLGSTSKPCAASAA